MSKDSVPNPIITVLVLLIVKATFVPLFSAFFGVAASYVFPETTQAFMQYIKFETVAFWQLMLIVGTISMVWSVGSPPKTNPIDKVK